MKNTERLNVKVIGDIFSLLRQKYSTKFNVDVNRLIDEMNEMTPNELMGSWLAWNGIICFSGSVKQAVASIYQLKLDNDPDRKWCCWTLSEEEVLKAMKDVGVPESYGLDKSDDNRESFVCDVVDRFKDALSVMGEEWEDELEVCVDDVVDAWQDRDDAEDALEEKLIEDGVLTKEQVDEIKELPLPK